MLARVLGPIEFGKIAAVGSVSTLLMPFSGLGAANLMIMRAARNPTLLQVYFGNSLLIASITGSILTAVSVVVIVPFLGSQIGFLLMLVYSVSELLFSKFTDICCHVFISNERMHWTSTFLVTQSISKLVAVSIFMWVAPHFACNWVEWALGSNVAVALGIIYLTTSQIGLPKFDVRLARHELWSGLPFAVSLSAKGFYTDVDKVYLARYGAIESVGMYTVAFRVAQMALVPIRAVSLAFQARYFRAGESGVRGSGQLALRLARAVIPLAVVLGVGFYVAAHFIALIAGPRYSESGTILKYLCAMPLLLAFQSLLGDVLAGSGNQRATAASQVLSAGLALVLCAVLIRRFDWRGAVAASYLSQLFLVTLLASIIIKLHRGFAVSIRS
jgi:O-antigen/teichoic acid export membrane protein